MLSDTSQRKIQIVFDASITKCMSHIVSQCMRAGWQQKDVYFQSFGAVFPLVSIKLLFFLTMICTVQVNQDSLDYLDYSLSQEKVSRLFWNKQKLTQFLIN